LPSAERLSSSTILAGIAAGTGALFTSTTVTVICSSSDRSGVPLSFANLDVKLPGPRSSVGVQQAPVVGLMVAPLSSPMGVGQRVRGQVRIGGRRREGGAVSSSTFLLPIVPSTGGGVDFLHSDLDDHVHPPGGVPYQWLNVTLYTPGPAPRSEST
jgi:hypothetical protein